MKKKCFIILVLSIGMFLLSTEYAMAATGLSKAEESILDRLKEGIEFNGSLIHLPAAYLNQVENELIRNEEDITAEQAESINNKVDQAAELLKTMSLSDMVNFKNSIIYKQLIVLVEEAAEIVNYSVSIDTAHSKVNVVDSNGNFVFASKNVINQTGFDMTQTVVVGGFLITLLAACIVLADRMKLSVKTLDA